MPSAAQITRFRRRKRASSLPGARAGLGCSLLVSLVIVLTGIFIAYLTITVMRGLPSLETLSTLLDPPGGLLLQPTRIYDRTGSHVLLTLQNPAASERQFLTLDERQPDYLPTVLISATLAVADPAFWNHPGYSLGGFLSPQIHPTLAQKLVSDLMLADESPSLRRALRERLLAAQITKYYGREQVLVWFLNSANYGRLAYGADAATRVYFGKPASRLNLAEAAILAGVMQSPSLNPLDAPKVAQERAGEVLQTMLAGGWINAVQASQAQRASLKFRPKVDPVENPAPVFANLALEQLGREFNLNLLERGGFKLITSLDYELQQQATCALQVYIDRLEGHPNTPGSANPDECQAARLLPTALPVTANLPQDLSGSVVILDHRSGQILALVGGVSPGQDPAHHPGHTPGSLLAPFIYLTGFTRGLSPASLLWDIPTGSGGLLNPDGKFHGPVRLRTALVSDDLTPMESVLNQVGAENVWGMSQQLGLEAAGLPKGKSARTLLEEGEVNLLEISRAYGVFANQGILAGQDPSPEGTSANAPSEAATLIRLEDAAGRIWLEDQAALERPVISPQLAYLMTHILSDEPARWSLLGHPNPLEIGRPFSAKLGRTASGQDAWAIGSTPQLTFGVWLGRSTGPARLAATTQDAASLLHAIAQHTSQGFPAEGWTMPPGISTLAVCDPSGMLPTPECPAVVNEIFLAGTEPVQFDTLYRKLQINRETGLLATVFTPPELVEERVYLMVPPEAQEWARLAGLPTPPQTFDVIQADSTSSPDAHIASPAMFAYVRGVVRINGNAGGSGFELYRLQVGQGLNPQRWLQVGQDVPNPVANGELGVWDTQGLSGLYALQLLVMFQDQRVQTEVVQVTVDNQPPQVTILNPTKGLEIPPSSSGAVLQAEVSDNLALQGAEFFIDDRLVSTLTQPPFTLTWQGQSGAHTLRVRATDQAGNSSQAEVSFRIK